MAAKKTKTNPFTKLKFTLKMRQMLSVYTSPEKFKSATITGRFGFVMRMTRTGRSRDYRHVIVFEKAGVFKFKFSNLKSVFEKLGFCDGLVWSVGQTVEIRLRFQIPPV